MPARRIVERLYIIEDIGPGLGTGAVDLAGYSLDFQRREEAFHRRVIPNFPGPAHAAGDAMLFEQLAEVFAGVLGFPDPSGEVIREDFLDAKWPSSGRPRPVAKSLSSASTNRRRAASTDPAQRPRTANLLQSRYR